MKNNKLKLIVAVIAILPLLALSNLAFAWEGTYQLSTGISTTTVNGTVIVAPTASPVAGTYTSTQSVTLAAAGASSIYYTTDGTIPACSTGTVYAGAISVGSSQTIQAISCYPENHSSNVVSFAYTINIPNTSTSGGGGGGGGSYYYSTPTPTPSVSPVISAGILDFNALMVNWGSTTPGNPADFNGDGKVDILDFNWLMIHWASLS